jgi:chromosome segregation ATPase
MGRKEKIKEMERRAEEMEEAIPVKTKEIQSLTDKLAANVEECRALSERLSEQLRKMRQRRSPSTSTTQQQEKVDLAKEDAVLEAEFAANKKEREQLLAACHAKREEYEELSKELKSLLNSAQLYLVPN